ncbi:ComEC/Rec2 family competence protein [Actinomadura flavalba]|uniref:ComEC/Rec2 family competence protein n=1 Tax=Actinomadura flavalba TaxID=1120938 RepID=UPI001F0AC97B|nr:ComEC/Rec2 family competence protein [Actinomadura flavalba]
MCVAGSAAAVGVRVAAVGSGPVRAAAAGERRGTAEVVVTGDPLVTHRGARQTVIVRARAEVFGPSGDMGRVRVRVPVLLVAYDERWRTLVPSTRVRVTGKFVPPRGGELLAAVIVVRGPPVAIGEPSRVQRAAEHVRARLRAAVAHLPGDQRAVLPGLVVGDTSGLDRSLTEAFRTAGLTHLLVVSGANLAIVIGAVLGVCGFLGARRRTATLVAVGAVLVFVVVVRPEPSVLRATVMGLIGLLALLSGRQRQGVPALCAAVVVLVLLDPALARSYGFALSVLATAGLLVLAPPWRERLRRRLPAPLADAVAVAAAAQLAVAPLLVTLSGELGVLAIVANLLAAPAVAPATILGAIAAVTALVALPVAQVIAWPAGLAVGWIAGVARTTAALPYATLPWPAGLPGAAAALAACVAAVLILRHRALLVLASATLAGVAVAVLLLRAVSPGWPPPGWLLVACDVGQGDALVLATGVAGQAVVVDTGPDPHPVDGCLRRLNVRTVPLLVLTHPHADHTGGVRGVRSGRSVHTVLTTPRSGARDGRDTGGLIRHGSHPGQTWRIGALTLTVLAPRIDGPPLTVATDGTTINDASIVLLARHPRFSALLTGDLEDDAQRALTPHVPPVDVLKVPHHGSKTQHAPFLAATRAPLALVSAGRDNDYGHPAPTTLTLLRSLHMRVHRTDQQGDLAIVPARPGLVVVTRR